VRWHHRIGNTYTWGWETRSSSGYYFKSTDEFLPEERCEIRVTFDNGHTLEQSLIDYPQTHHIQFYASYSTHPSYKIPGDGRHQMLRPYLNNKRDYYYEYEPTYAVGSWLMSHSEEVDGSITFLVGGQYVRLVDDHYEWTNEALYATERFIISVRQNDSGKISSFEVDPTKYKLTNNTEFIVY
jgi:hypothetical protein